MRHLKRYFFTLAELLIVAVIIGIIVAIAVPSYRKAVNASRDKEARAMLNLISQAEETYFLETRGFYIDCDESGAQTCSGELHLDLPGQNWNFLVKRYGGGATPQTYCVQATSKISTYSKTWRFYPAGGDSEPTDQAGGCP